VATRYRELVSGGVLQGYLLDSYAARKLGMQSTASAGGVRNASIGSSGQSFEELLRTMGRGVLVTELMGQGTNMVTGDYSRGAAGFWVEGGEIRYPIEEITVAGNLADMYRQLVAVGTDSDIPGSIRTGSWLFERMTVGGD
jgi:PmbA protein